MNQYLYNTDFQRSVLKLLCTNIKFAMDYGLLLKPEYFDSHPLKLIFNLIQKHILTYEQELDASNLYLLIDEMSVQKGYETQMVELLKEESRLIFSSFIKCEQFIIDQLIKFVRGQELKNALIRSTEILEQGGEYERVLKLVDQAVSIGSGESEGMSFNDIKNLPQKYRLSYDPSKLVKTGFMTFDNILGGGMAPGELHVMQGNPKCLLSFTKIRLLNGEIITIDELVNKKEFWVYSCKPDGAIVPGRGHSCRITNHVKETLKITLDNNEIIECTPEHKFMLRSGVYKEAKDLTKEDSLMPLYERAPLWDRLKQFEKFLDNNNHKIIKIEKIVYENPIPVYCFTVDKYHNFALDAGVFVANSGKSTMAANIGAYNLMSGKAVFHITLEIKELDVLVKYATRLSGTTYDHLLKMSKEEYDGRLEKFFTRWKPNLYIKHWTQKTVNTLAIRSWISRIRSKTGVNPGLIIVDYDDLLLPVGGAKDMYEDGGSVYSDLIAIADYFNVPILTFAQPNREAWTLPEKNELIYAHHIAHSAKKIHNAFSISSLNFKNSSDSGYLYADMLRRGTSNYKVNMIRHLDKATFLESEI